MREYDTWRKLQDCRTKRTLYLLHSENAGSIPLHEIEPLQIDGLSLYQEEVSKVLQQ